MTRRLRAPFPLPLCAVLVVTACLLARAQAPAKAHDEGQWEKDVAAFEQADKASRPPANAILFVGSSTIARWKTLQQDFAKFPIINRGFGGNEIADSTYFADRIILPYRPRR